MLGCLVAWMAAAMTIILLAQVEPIIFTIGDY
jgi:hypothetical protein